MLGQDVTIQTKCPVTGESVQLKIGVGGPTPGTSGFIHFAVPAAQWWNDIGYT
jgi:hypothetical protein